MYVCEVYKELTQSTTALFVYVLRLSIPFLPKMFMFQLRKCLINIINKIQFPTLRILFHHKNFVSNVSVFSKVRCRNEGKPLSVHIFQIATFVFEVVVHFTNQQILPFPSTSLNANLSWNVSIFINMASVTLFYSYSE